MDMTQFIDLLQFQMNDVITDYLTERVYVTQDVEKDQCAIRESDGAMLYNNTTFASIGSDEFSMSLEEINEIIKTKEPTQVARNVLDNVMYSLKVEEDLYMHKKRSPFMYQLRKPVFAYNLKHHILVISAHEVIGAR